jgi:hypothetical protein
MLIVPHILVKKHEQMEDSSIILHLLHHRSGVETWSLTLRDENRLRVFENRVLRRIFGPKRDEVTGEWRKLHNEKLHILYSSPNIIRQIKSRRMRWTGHVARMGEECVQGFDGKARRKHTTWKTKA